MSIYYRILLMVFVIILSIYVTAYTLEAYHVANYYAAVDGTPVWITTPPGSFFPWPRGSGPGQACSEMSLMDQFILLRLIKTGILFAVSILLWILVVVCQYYCWIRRNNRQTH